MSAGVALLVGAGVALTLALGASRGLDALGWVLLALIVALGALGVAVARRSARGAVAPVRCADCDGLVSANAPYCKHCGAPRKAR